MTINENHYHFLKEKLMVKNKHFTMGNSKARELPKMISLATDGP